MREDVIGGIGMSRPNAFSKPHNPAHWTTVGLHRAAPPPSSFTNSFSLGGEQPGAHNFTFLLPRDRRLAQRVLDCYFDNLNPHRPVFMRGEFMKQVDALYDSLVDPAAYGQGHGHRGDEDVKMQMHAHAQAVGDETSGAGPSASASGSGSGSGPGGGSIGGNGNGGGSKYRDLANDAGFLCSVYLVFALGTMAVRNRRVHHNGTGSGAGAGSEADGDEMSMWEEHWPSHEDFYDLALLLKPDLANSISTLQALILLHWYLYCEVRHSVPPLVLIFFRFFFFWWWCGSSRFGINEAALRVRLQ